MNPVLLAGAFGQGNPGDEALLSAFTHALTDRDVVATSSDPADTERRHGVRAIARHDSASVAREVAGSGAVVFAGGTVFKPLHPTCGRGRLDLLRRGLVLASGAKALRKPLALVGVGAGELEGIAARGLARRIARRSDLLVLRDEESAHALGDAGAPTPLRVGADPTWALLDTPDQDARHGQAVIVAISHLAGGRDLAADLAAGLTPLVEQGIPVVLQPWQEIDGGGDDVALAEAERGLLGNAVELEPPPIDLDAAIACFRDHARVVVGLRFHSLVAAAAAGVPFVAVTHELKLAALARRLDQPGVAPENVASALPTALAHAMTSEPPSADAVRNEIDSAEGAFRLLRVLLDGGRSAEAVAVDGLKLAPEEWLS